MFGYLLLNLSNTVATSRLTIPAGNQMFPSKRVTSEDAVNFSLETTQ